MTCFIDMVLIENINDECECCKRAGEELNYEDIKEAAECLINDIALALFYTTSIMTAKVNRAIVRYRD